MREKRQSGQAGLRKVLCGLAVATLLFSPPVKAKEGTGPSQPFLQADRIHYDEKADTVTALGHVEIAKDDQILRADKVVYEKKTNVVRATGHVAMTQPSGEILYAEKAEVTSDMKEAFLSKIRILFPDGSRLAAHDAQRYEGRYLVTQKGVYSACHLCESDPLAPPLWQVKGVRVTHDAEEKDVIYRDAIIEFAGVPVFYTPYFSHPDPTVARRQGFLPSYIGHSSNIGLMTSVPYYFDLAPHSDLVVMPTFSEEDKIQMAADWRHRFQKGSMRWRGSFARTDFTSDDDYHKGYQWRGHLFGESQFDLSDTWRAGTDVAFASDKSYMPRYKIGSDDLLVNRAYAERFKGRDYAVGNMYYFQDMRPGDTQEEPFVAPELRYSALGEPNKTLGGRWSFGSSLLVITRRKDAPAAEQGANTRRLSLDAGWERQMVSETGFLTDLSLLTRGDAYWADNVPETKGGTTSFSKTEHVRPFAQASLTVRYPLGRRGENYQHILEPIAVLSAAPRVRQESLLPNEDSLDVEFDETNLFSQNRFTGLDRIEGGTRVAYGLRNTFIGDNGGRIQMLGGQVFRMKKDMSFPEGSGLRDRFSDYVGRIAVAPSELLDASYGFRISKEDSSFARQQFVVSAGKPVFRPMARYLFSRETEASTLTGNEKLEEAAFGFNSAFAHYWSLSAYHNQAFQPQPGARSTTLTILYKDECFEASLSGQRKYTYRTDVKAGTSVMFRFYLKNIGGWESSKITAGG